MKLYRISRGQLRDVMEQEGASPEWYGRLLCLEVGEDGIPVYTLTSEIRHAANAPSPAYADLIAGALETELALGKEKARAYMEKCLRSK